MTAAASRTRASRSATATACFTPARRGGRRAADRRGLRWRWRRAAVSNKDDGGHLQRLVGLSLGLVIVDNALYHGGMRVPLGDGDDRASATRGCRATRVTSSGSASTTPAPDELELIARTFDLHPLAVEDAGDSHQRPKVERYGDTLFLVLKTLWYVDEEDAVETGEINMFVGRDFIVTVRHGEGINLSDSRHDLERTCAGAGARPDGGHVRHLRPRRRRVREGRGGAGGGRGRGGGVGVLPRPHRRLRPDLRPQARDRRGPPRGPAAARADAEVLPALRHRPDDPHAHPHHGGDRDLLPRRGRPPPARLGGDRQPRRPAVDRVRRPSGAHLGPAERGHAQDLRRRRARRGADPDRRRSTA